jgi:glycerate dehydrogenase
VRSVIVNDADLTGALRSGEIGPARIDALTHKPPDDDHLLLADNLPDLVVDSHNAWGSVESQQRLANEVTALAHDYKSGTPRHSSLPA